MTAWQPAAPGTRIVDLTHPLVGHAPTYPGQPASLFQTVLPCVRGGAVVTSGTAPGRAAHPPFDPELVPALEQAYQDRSQPLALVSSNPAFERLHDDARYGALMEKLYAGLKPGAAP